MGERLKIVQVQWLHGLFCRRRSSCCRGGRQEETTTGTKEGASETNRSVRVEHTSVCCRGLTATRSGVHRGVTQQERSTCFRAKISRLEPMILTSCVMLGQAVSLSEFIFLSSKRGNLISLAYVKSFLELPKMISSRAFWMTRTSLMAFQETKGQRSFCLVAFQRRVNCCPSPFQLLGLWINCNQAKQTNKKVVIHDQQNGTNDVIHHDGHPNLPTIFS